MSKYITKMSDSFTCKIINVKMINVYDVTFRLFFCKLMRRVLRDPNIKYQFISLRNIFFV